METAEHQVYSGVLISIAFIQKLSGIQLLPEHQKGSNKISSYEVRFINNKPSPGCFSGLLLITQ
jgi:hypothetical protein